MAFQPRTQLAADVVAKQVGRLLLVEADVVIAAGLCQALESVGFSVSVVRCLQDALGQLDAEPDYSAVICEYYLPDGTSLELLERLRDDQDLRVPMLLISGCWTRPLPSQRGLGFLTKPFNGAQLLDALYGLIQMSPPDGRTVASQFPAL